MYANSAAGIEPPSSMDYFRFPRGTFSLPNGKPAGTRRREGDMHREDREGRSAATGGSGGGTDDQWTEEDFKQRVRERLDRIEGHGEGPSGGRGGRGEGRGEGRSEGRGRRRRSG